MPICVNRVEMGFIMNKGIFSSKIVVKKFIALLFIFHIIIIAFACDNKKVNYEDISIETYRYLPEFKYISHVNDLIQKMITHEEIIYFVYAFKNSDDSTESPDYVPVQTTIIIEGMQQNNRQISKTEFIVPYNYIAIAHLGITRQNNFSLIIQGYDWIGTRFEFTILYLEVTPEGTVTTTRDFTDQFQNSYDSFILNTAIITERNNIIIHANKDLNNDVIYLFNNQYSVKGRMEIAAHQHISKLRDGRIVVSDIEKTVGSINSILREVDFSSYNWGKTHRHPFTDIFGLYPARENDLFDIYVNDGIYLYGYIPETEESIQILNWQEVRVGLGHKAHFAFSEDGEISLITSSISTGTWYSEYVFLSRILRADFPEKEIITIGGFGINSWPEIINSMWEFNKNNAIYELQMIDYFDQYGLEKNNILEFRFLIDIITGRAPDIIFGDVSSLISIAEKGYLLDLYIFIDTDPILSRSDFIPNILHALETGTGMLPVIGNTFNIETIIGMANVVGDIQQWTLTDMLDLINRTDAVKTPNILFEWMTSERFLEEIFQATGSNFVNWIENIAYLDSEEFIQLLEISSRFSNVMHPFENYHPTGQMLLGNQLLHLEHINNPATYQYFTGMLGDDLIALGFPTKNGGSNRILMSGLAVNQNSKHQEKAWEFIRMLLLPNDNPKFEYWSPIPLRIDLFDEYIKYSKTPIMVVNADGNEVETGKVGMQQGGGPEDQVVIYAMTDAEERGFRSIIENANIVGHFDEITLNIVKEEAAYLFAGIRSAADAAHIIQNRVQTYLYERR